MIKIESDKGNVEAKIEGSLLDIIADCCVSIRSVWQALKKDNEDAAKLFEALFKKAIDDIFSEDVELKDHHKKILEERAEKEVGNKLDEIMTMLDELLESLEDKKGE